MQFGWSPWTRKRNIVIPTKQWLTWYSKTPHISAPRTHNPDAWSLRNGDPLLPRWQVMSCITNGRTQTDFRPSKHMALEHPQPRLAGSTPAPNVKACPCTLSYDDRRRIMDRLPVSLLYFSKEFHVKSPSKYTKTIYAKITYATPSLLSIRHYFATKMAVQNSKASWVPRILYQRLLRWRIKGVWDCSDVSTHVIKCAKTND